MKRDAARISGWAENLFAVVVLFMIAVAIAQADSVSWTGLVDNDWDVAGNWNPEKVPEAGDTVSITTGTPVLTHATPMLFSVHIASGRTLTVEGWDSVLRAETMIIEGIITHAINDVASTNASGEWVPQHRILLEGSNITVAVTGILDAQWKGYRRTQGPGTSGLNFGGAGHAGPGGHARGNRGGPAYGEVDQPWQPGSGGGLNANSREGGGAIRVIATGTLTVHGAIRASGQNNAGTHGSGGSGGSIWLDCRVLAGSATGLIQAKGGNGNYYGGAGSGGRIAVHYDPDAQAQEPVPAIRFEGTPGTHTSHNTEQFRPLMATLYFPDTQMLDNHLTAKRFQWVQIHIPDWTVWEAEELTLDDCIVGLSEGTGLNVTNHLVLTNNAALHMFAAPVADVLAEPGAEVTVGGDLRVHSGCWVLPHADPTNGATVAFTIDGNLLVAAGGGFDADERGYTRGHGPGLQGSSHASYGAAGHGGISGMAFGGHRWGNAYGDAQYPIEAGSGAMPDNGGRGGGAIRLAVGGRAELHGTLTAKGAAGNNTHGGGGSGGSILLECETLAGSNSALLTVDGGQGNYYGGCGGGGRIAVHYDPVQQAALGTPVPPIRFSAFAWPYTTYQDTRYMVNAREGTLWLPDALFLTETIDQQRFRHLQLVIPGFTFWSPASVTVDDCIFTLPEGFVLDVAADLTLDNDAALYIYAAPTNDPGQRYGAEIRVGRDLTVGTNSWIFPQAHTSNAAIVGIRVGRDATITAGGGIDAWGRGWMGRAGNTQGSGAGKHAYGGGGYGGMGGGDAGRGGDTYGIPELPWLPGSPAGWNAYGGGHGVGGPGGGVIHLRAGGHLRIDGLLSADGWNGAYYQGGGGSGGAIFLAAHRFSGAGEIRAKGGIAGNDVASGGGGRIAIWHSMSLTMIESRIETRSTDGLLQHDDYARFSGDVDVGWYGESEHGLPGEGSKSFYTIHGTVISIR